MTETTRSEVARRVLDHLRSHPNQGCCTRCLATILGTSTRRVGNAALVLEGYPSIARRYDSCSVCRQQRLLVFAVDDEGEVPGPSPAP